MNIISQSIDKKSVKPESNGDGALRRFPAAELRGTAAQRDAVHPAATRVVDP